MIHNREREDGGGGVKGGGVKTIIVRFNLIGFTFSRSWRHGRRVSKECPGQGPGRERESSLLEYLKKKNNNPSLLCHHKGSTSQTDASLCLLIFSL